MKNVAKIFAQIISIALYIIGALIGFAIPLAIFMVIMNHNLDMAVNKFAIAFVIECIVWFFTVPTCAILVHEFTIKAVVHSITKGITK